MDTQSIQQVRCFNRMVAERVGAVNDRFLGRDRPMTEAIALYRRCGYREVEVFNDDRYPHHWFEKRLDEA